MRVSFANPTPQWIGGLFVAAAALFVVSAWMANSEDSDTSVFSYLPLLIGLILLFMALALLALRALNRIPDPPAN